MDELKQIESKYNLQELRDKQDGKLKLANKDVEGAAGKYKITPSKSIYEIALENLNSVNKTRINERLNISFEEAIMVLQAIIRISGKNLIYTETEKEIIRNLIKYFLNDGTGKYDIKKGIYMYGFYGSGKTQLLQLFQAFTNLLNYNKFDKINYKILNDKIKIQGIKAAENISKYNNLFVDDLGFLNESKINSFGNTYDLLMSIVNERYEKWFYSNIKTFYTTNILIDNIKEIYGEGISGRIIDSCNFIKFTETSHRR